MFGSDLTPRCTVHAGEHPASSALLHVSFNILVSPRAIAPYAQISARAVANPRASGALSIQRAPSYCRSSSAELTGNVRCRRFRQVPLARTRAVDSQTFRETKGWLDIQCSLHFPIDTCAVGLWIPTRRFARPMECVDVKSFTRYQRMGRVRLVTPLSPHGSQRLSSRRQY